jgi:hypothetical protein
MRKFGYIDYEETDGGCNRRNTYHLKKLSTTVLKQDSNCPKTGPLTVPKRDSQLPLEYTTVNIPPTASPVVCLQQEIREEKNKLPFMDAI